MENAEGRGVVLVQTLFAGVTANGNGRRAHVFIVPETGHVAGAVVGAYSAARAVIEWRRYVSATDTGFSFVELPEYRVTPSEVQSWRSIDVATEAGRAMVADWPVFP